MKPPLPGEPGYLHPETLRELRESQQAKKCRVHNKYAKTAPEDAVYIGRGSKWGNPFVIGRDGTREDVINKFETYLTPNMIRAAKRELRGKDLICFCAPRACHGDVLMRIANKRKGKPNGQ